MVLCVGRHSVVKQRRTSPAVLASVIAPAAVLFAFRADVETPEPVAEVDHVVDTAAPCCVQIVPVTPEAPESVQLVGQVSMSSAPAGMAMASRARYRAVDPTLPVGLAPERGLQVKTILASRAITAAFPQIRSIGGQRADSLPWHPNGLAIDVMIPNPGTSEGIALGNAIVEFVMRNAHRFGMQDAIWRGRYYTPNGARTSGAGHFDHVHITTTGGGYPTGSEIYFR
jgi:hypothetical protein